MLKIEFVNEDETVVFTKHGDERRVMRDGQMVGVARERIEKIIRNNFQRIKPFWGRFNTFVFRNPIDGLNVAGELVRNGDDWTFKVVTVMFKHNFKPYFKDYVVKVNESERLMMFGSFMESHDMVSEIATHDGDVFEYEQIEADEKQGTFEWLIKVVDNGELIDEMLLKIEHSKDPITGPEMNTWITRFNDLIECLGMFDGDDNNQKKALAKNFDMKKWSRLLDIAEVEMLSTRTDYEPTGHGKTVALKLLRTRFKIVTGWVNTYKPDVFLSNPKKESQDDTRRLRIYEIYFKKYLTDYKVYTKDMTDARPWFSSDILVCISDRVDNRMLSSLEEEVEAAIY